MSVPGLAWPGQVAAPLGAAPWPAPQKEPPPQGLEAVEGTQLVPGRKG